MGVKYLWSIIAPVKKEVPLTDLKGKTIAVDLSVWICENSGVKAMQGRVTKPHLRGLFFRVSYLYQIGVKLVFVVDGEPPELKWETISSRVNVKFAGKGRRGGGNTKQRTSRSRFNSLIKECLELLDFLGVPYVQSKGEAEAMCALLNERGIVDACITEDGDVFLYGGQTVYRNFNLIGKKPVIELYSMSDVTERLGLSRETLVGLALLLGCDYVPKGVPGVGKIHAMQLVRQLEGQNILKRFQDWSKEASSSDTLTNMPAHCSYCHHVGSAKLHKSKGCPQCTGTTTCSTSGSTTPCACTWHDAKRQYDVCAIERGIRLKANKIPNFPQKDVISEFLNTKDVCPTHQLKKSRPDMVKLMKFAHEKMEWTAKYTREKVVDLVTLYDLQFSCQTDLKLDHIMKRRVVNFTPSLEVAWKLPDSWRLEEDDTELISTIENLDLFKSVYPEVLLNFEALKNSKKGRKKGKRVKKPAKCKDMAETNLDLVTEGLMQMDLHSNGTPGKDLVDQEPSTSLHQLSDNAERDDDAQGMETYQDSESGSSAAEDVKDAPTQTDVAKYLQGNFISGDQHNESRRCAASLDEDRYIPSLKERLQLRTRQRVRQERQSNVSGDSKSENADTSNDDTPAAHGVSSGISSKSNGVIELNDSHDTSNNTREATSVEADSELYRETSLQHSAENTLKDATSVPEVLQISTPDLSFAGDGSNQTQSTRSLTENEVQKKITYLMQDKLHEHLFSLDNVRSRHMKSLKEVISFEDQQSSYLLGSTTVPELHDVSTPNISLMDNIITGQIMSCQSLESVPLAPLYKPNVTASFQDQEGQPKTQDSHSHRMINREKPYHSSLDDHSQEASDLLEPTEVYDLCTPDTTIAFENVEENKQELSNNVITISDDEDDFSPRKITKDDATITADTRRHEDVSTVSINQLPEASVNTTADTKRHEDASTDSINQLPEASVNTITMAYRCLNVEAHATYDSNLSQSKVVASSCGSDTNSSHKVKVLLEDNPSRGPTPEPTLVDINTPFQTPLSQPETALTPFKKREEDSLSSGGSFSTPVFKNDISTGSLSYYTPSTELQSFETTNRFQTSDNRPPSATFVTPGSHCELEKSLDHSLFHGLNFSLNTSPWNCWTPSPVIRKESKTSKLSISDSAGENKTQNIRGDTEVHRLRERSMDVTPGGGKEQAIHFQTTKVKNFKTGDLNCGGKRQPPEFKNTNICRTQSGDDHVRASGILQGSDYQRTKMNGSAPIDGLDVGGRKEGVNFQRTKPQRSLTDGLQDGGCENYQGFRNTRSEIFGDGLALKGELWGHEREQGMQRGKPSRKVDETKDGSESGRRYDEPTGHRTTDGGEFILRGQIANVCELSTKVENLQISHKQNRDDSRSSHTYARKEDYSMKQHIQRNMPSSNDKENSPVALMDRLRKRNVRHRDILKSMELD